MTRYFRSVALWAALLVFAPLFSAPPVLYDKDTATAAGNGSPAFEAAGGQPQAEPAPGESPLKTPPKKKIFRVLKECPPEMQYIVVNFNPKKVYEICIDRYEYPNIKGEMPKVDVTWYMAHKLCEEQGKFLCWEKEWIMACLGPSNYDFSYYNVYDQQRCNVQSEAILPSGAKPQCKTNGYDVYDMVGNAREWMGDGGIGAVGGSYKDGRSARCSRWDFLAIQKTYPDVGFRCCAKVFTGRYGKVPDELLKAGPAPVQKPAAPAPVQKKPATPR